MISHTAIYALQTGLLAATSTKKSGGSPVFLILLVLLFAVYFLWLRPKRNQMRSQQAQMQAAEVGDEVVTTGGIIGRVVSYQGDRVELEVAPGQQLTFLKSAIGRRIDPIVPESADDVEDLSNRDEGTHDVDTNDADDQSPRRWWPGAKGGDDTPPTDAGGPN